MIEAKKPRSQPLIEWAVAARPFPGETVSGDLHAVEQLPDGVLVAVMDGLGHGRAAAASARTAASAVKDYAPDPLPYIFERCHERLKRMRGVVMTLAWLDALDGTMTWLGVGNVEGVLLRADAGGARARARILMRGGVVGYRLPSLSVSTTPLSRDDTLVLVTDGIASSFADELTLDGSPQQMADLLLARHAKETDDALVLIARYLGGTP